MRWTSRATRDAALLFVGLNGEWDTEGLDRPHMDLPGRQDELIERVAAASPRTVVVLQTGGPVTMPWLERVGAVIEAWYPGQECGNAIADVLLGKVDPGGRLPQTFPVRLEDNPAFPNYPGANGRVRYEEGIFVGYRHYERQGIRPLFPFGHGLSYTTFEYGHLRLDAESIEPGDEITVTVELTNTGARAGQEVVQLYVRDEQACVPRPEKELKALAKLALEPGETRAVTLTLGMRALAFFDEGRAAWVAEPGTYEVLVGSSSADIRPRAAFRLMAEWFSGRRRRHERPTTRTRGNAHEHHRCAVDPALHAALAWATSTKSWMQSRPRAIAMSRRSARTSTMRWRCGPSSMRAASTLVQPCQPRRPARAAGCGGRRLPRLGFTQLFMPAVPPEQRDMAADGWRALGRELGQMAERFEKQGIQLGYHNHHWELAPKEGAKTALELIFEAAGASPLTWEADVAWLVRGNVEPEPWLRRYSDRLVAAHVKDIAPAGQNEDEDGWADVGSGVLDWRALWKAARDAGAEWMVVEHDKPKDPARTASTSFAYLRGIEG